MSTLERAIEIAVQAHKGQVDKGGQPYILHPLRVMMSLETEKQKIVGVLHDVLEDSQITMRDLAYEGFSNDILFALNLLSRYDLSYSEYITRLADNDLATTTVKIADLKDNMDIFRISALSLTDIRRWRKYYDAYLYLNTGIKDGWRIK